MGKFEKGKSGNPNGRPKGSRNKTHKELRAMLVDALQDEFQSLRENLKTLPFEKRAIVIARLLPYVLPRLTEEQEQGEDELKVVVKYV